MDDLKEGDVVVVQAFDDLPEHLFEVHEVHEDCVTGCAITGPLVGVYGEPEFELILRITYRAVTPNPIQRRQETTDVCSD
ncbi:hypothetical protein ASD8599_03093 [Ascidiaceihabitans donghaensis]|uniref:DUF4926 domain-containing protein n=1 Tax=Ascidiaceihabitans donghaensis TaxID=1510460 RepID=A0A2R8BGT3_9RHOB|nr:hypothetical protein [Ascidiaceihabitans donghaensis]SPH22349.1 hypothetical protein ASD8599_03093 [Ascidiaceihabitans donghaensis]